MSEYIAQPGQTLVDIVMATVGNIAGLPAVASANGLSMTGNVVAGQVIVIPDITFPVVASSAGATAQQARTATVAPGQTLYDIAIQYCGGVDAIVGLAAANSLSLSATLSAGQILQVPNTINKRVRRAYDEAGWRPAAGDILNTLEGVDYWAIEYDFIVQ